jgi:hypothetical protein
MRLYAEAQDFLLALLPASAQTLSSALSQTFRRD